MKLIPDCSALVRFLALHRGAFGRSVAVIVTTVSLTVSATAATAQIDASAPQQTIRGFGGATVFQPPGLSASLTPAELDLLFGNAPNQIGLSLLRIRVATDDAWRAIELGHARGALSPRVICLS